MSFPARDHGHLIVSQARLRRPAPPFIAVVSTVATGYVVARRASSSVRASLGVIVSPGVPV
jgi:hypothetical protein